MEHIYKIRHIPTGLYYCSRKGRWNDTKTNLSKKGNFYTSLNMAKSVLKDCNNSIDINKAQVEKYKLDIHGNGRFSYSKAKLEDLKIVKFKILEEGEIL